MTMTQSPRSTFNVGTDLQVAFKEFADNSKCAVDQWAIKVDGTFILANLIKPHAAPDDARWLFGSATTPKGKPVWNYKDDKRVLSGFDGFVFSVIYDGQTCLAYVTKGKNPEVAYVVPLRTILAQHEVEESLFLTISRKRSVAKDLDYGIKLTPAEVAVNTFLQEQERVERQAREANEKAERDAVRAAKVAAILGRKHLRVYAGGRFVQAIYVYENEWQMLPPKTRVILGEDGSDGLFHPKETFMVFKGTKRGAQPEKSFVSKVGAEPSEAASASTQLPKPVANKVVFVDGQPFEVPTFSKIEDLQAHRAAGLNSGALRGVVADNGINLFKVRTSGLEQVAASSFKLIG